MKVVFDAENTIVGRLGTRVCKELLKGKEVDVLNAEKAIVSGNKEVIVARITKLRRMGRGGSLKGPKISKMPDRLLKSMMRGMMPRDRAKGREAYKRLKCYTSKANPEVKEEVIKLGHKKPTKYSTIAEISKSL